MKEKLFHQLENIRSKYCTDNIFILGKGPSADSFDRTALDNGLVIALNDAERIAPADISIFHAEWVKESLELNGYQSELYVSSQALPGNVPVFPAEYIPLNHESSDLIIQRFYDETLSIEEIMFFTALKIARFFSEWRMRRQQVYLLGFDFDRSRGFSKAVSHDFSEDEEKYQSHVISIQEHYLLMFLHVFRNSGLFVQHVGDKVYSALSPEKFAGQFSGSEERLTSYPESSCDEKRTVVHRRGRSKSNEVLVVAEITTNHFGDTDRLCKMVRLSAEAGADLVKVQKRNVETFYTEEQLSSPYASPFGNTFGDYRKALELTKEQFAVLDRVTQECGIRWFPSILDIPSFRFFQSMNLPLIKLPSTISPQHQLIEAVAREYAGRVVVSTGLTDQAYENYIIETFKASPVLYLLQCNSAYPTPPHECNLGVIRHYHVLSRTYPNIIPGYSSHDVGSEGSMLAVAAGARMIEKHVKIENVEWAHFGNLALDLSNHEFSDFVQDIRRAELLCGANHKNVNEGEHHKYWISPVTND